MLVEKNSHFFSVFRIFWRVMVHPLSLYRGLNIFESNKARQVGGKRKTTFVQRFWMIMEQFFAIFDDYAHRFYNLPTFPLLQCGHFVIVTLGLRRKIGKTKIFHTKEQQLRSNFFVHLVYISRKLLLHNLSSVNVGVFQFVTC